MYFTACFARCLFHVISLPCCPEQTLTDQPNGHKTNLDFFAITVRGGRRMVNEKQVKVQSMNRDIAGLRPRKRPKSSSVDFRRVFSGSRLINAAWALPPSAASSKRCARGAVPHAIKRRVRRVQNRYAWQPARKHRPAPACVASILTKVSGLAHSAGSFGQSQHGMKLIRAKFQRCRSQQSGLRMRLENRVSLTPVHLQLRTYNIHRLLQGNVFP